MKKIDYKEGDKIGVLVFLRDIKSHDKYRMAEFKCPICESSFTTRVSDAKNLKATKCKKCRYKSLEVDNDTKRIKATLKNMKQRCYNKNSLSYKHYGARDISICSLWYNDSNEFVKWALNNGYKDGLSIERIDVNGNYEPSNCTWIELSKQSENKRDLRKYKYIGVYPYKNGYTTKISINGKSHHIGWFKSEQEAALSRDNFILKNRLKHKLNF